MPGRYGPVAPRTLTSIVSHSRFPTSTGMAGPRLQSSPLPHWAYPALANHGADSPAHTVRATAPSVYQLCRQLAVHKLIHFIAMIQPKLEPPIVKESEIVGVPLSAVAWRRSLVQQLEADDSAQRLSGPVKILVRSGR